MTAAGEGHRDLLATIGKAIRLRRVELDLKRAELAERAGLSYAYVSEIENGTKQASTKALWQLAHALGLEPHQLLASAARMGEAPGPSPDLAALGAAAAVPLAGGAEGPAPAAGRWFHSATPPGRRARRADPAGEEPPSESPALPDLLARLDATLEGVPDERAELALLLALDDRRTRRIVREELDRRRRG